MVKYNFSSKNHNVPQQQIIKLKAVKKLRKPIFGEEA
jgi:hypothetical protein